MIEYRLFSPRNEKELMSQYDYGKRYEPIRFIPADPQCLNWTEDEFLFSCAVAKYQDLLKL